MQFKSCLFHISPFSSIFHLVGETYRPQNGAGQVESLSIEYRYLEAPKPYKTQKRKLEDRRPQFPLRVGRPGHNERQHDIPQPDGAAGRQLKHAAGRQLNGRQLNAVGRQLKPRPSGPGPATFRLPGQCASLDSGSDPDSEPKPGPKDKCRPVTVAASVFKNECGPSSRRH
jgi:hypothetical protein